MGVDLLEIRFRIEETFGVRVDPGLFLSLDDSGRVCACTVGELHERLIRAIDANRTNAMQDRECAPDASRPTDDEVWNSLARLLIDVLAVKPAEITREARLVEDLGAE
jgi:acyl carrier protein